MRARIVGMVSAGLALAALASCRASPESSNDSLPARSCSVVVWHHPQSAASHVEVVGDWNGWSRPGLAMNTTSTAGWLAVSIPMTPGEHLYSIVEDGTWLVDPNVP